MSKCGKGCMPECEYFTTGGCVSPFNCPYKIEHESITTATSTPLNSNVIYMDETYKDKEITRLTAENAGLQATISKMETVEKELRERLEKAGEIPNVFNKDIVTILYDKYYDKYKIPNLYNAKVVGIGVDTYALYEGKIDIIMAALCENGDVHFLHGRQYKKKWFLREDRSEAEARLEELKGGRE